jgi:hypothetical protein
LVVRYPIKASPERDAPLKAIYPGGGSVGTGVSARLLVMSDPNDSTRKRRVMAAVKCNLAAPPPALAFRIEGVGGVARITWEGAVDVTAEPSRFEEAKRLLLAQLATGPRPAKDVRREAQRAGIGAKTLERAKKALAVRSKKTAFEGSWAWELRAGPTGRGGRTAPAPEGEGR